MLQFKQMYADACVYICSNDHNGFVIFLYVDDVLLLVSNNVDLISKAKKLLSSRFPISVTGRNTVFGFSIVLGRRTVILSVHLLM